MATYAARAQAIVGTGVMNNAAATNAQIDRVGLAIARMTGNQDYYLALGLAARAEYIVRYYRELTLGWVRTTDAQAAAQAAADAAAADLPEAP